MERIFLRLKDQILKKDRTVLDFNSRPGVSYSLRGSVSKKGTHLFVLIDVIDDNPKNRWLSICFYAGTVFDPEGRGELIPSGILGEDGYCFDVTEQDDSLIPYVERRMQEAYEQVKRLSTAPS